MPATGPPNSFDSTITIRNGHTVTADSNVDMDQVTIENGGALDLTNASCSINNGGGIDLDVFGILVLANGQYDLMSNANIVFNNGSTLNWGVDAIFSGGVIDMLEGAGINLPTNGNRSLIGNVTINNYTTWNISLDNTITASGTGNVINNFDTLNFIHQQIFVAQPNAHCSFINSGTINFDGSSQTTFNENFELINLGNVNIVNGSTLTLGPNNSPLAGNIDIDLGCNLTIDNLTFIGDNIANDGNINGDITFAGNALQQLSGDGNIFALHINNANGVNVISGTNFISDFLEIINGKLSHGVALLKWVLNHLRNP
ncbi:MAG: hypothetical protein IPP29_04460 [Bacteroidetes bacterium]|nr:hypothetical protein [Bacteroidota bacterium]